MPTQRGPKEWEQLYEEKDPESMPWFHPGLDPDLERALRDLGIPPGKALDLGTGPGTQAIALAERGFEVTATDVSPTAIAKARARAAPCGAALNLRIDFLQDDILQTALSGEFDIVLDRGCFHVLAPERREEYVRVVRRLLRPGGFLFLKCFSHLETREEGPHRFAPEEIRAIFGRGFRARSITETAYQGTLDPFPKALFSVLEAVE